MPDMKPIHPLDAFPISLDRPGRVHHTRTEALARIMEDAAYMLAAEVKEADPLLAARLYALEDELTATGGDAQVERRADELSAEQMKAYNEACATFTAMGLRGLATYWETCPEDCEVCRAQQA